MERFGIDKRTVYRDLKALEESGIPITGDSRTGYSLVDGYKLPPLMFTREEAMAFLAAEKLIGQFTDSFLQEKYRCGIDKIRAVMRLADKEVISVASDKIGILELDNRQETDKHSILQILMDAACRGNKVEITYYSHNSNTVTTRTVDPVGVFFSERNWYMKAFCNERKDYRTFKVSRIREIHTTDLPIGKNHPLLNELLLMLKPDLEKDLYEVLLSVDKKDYYIIDETKYSNGLVEEKTENSRVVMLFRVFSLERFARWMLSYADIMTILDSPQLKKICRDIMKISKI